jgi:hypothetical protein
MPSLYGLLNGDGYQTFRRTNIDTRFAAGAGVTDHRVDLFGCTDDGISGTHFITPGAADAGGFSDFREYWGVVFHVG